MILLFALLQVFASDEEALYARVVAIRYGLECEDKAAGSYLSIVGPLHRGLVRLHKVALYVPVDDGHLGVSIDRIATCSCSQSECKQTWIVEIKCLYSIRTYPPGLDMALEKLDFLEVSPSGIRLKESAKYCTQVEMHMGVSKIYKAELWISSINERPLAPITVTYNDLFWAHLKAKLDVFYAKYVCPSIVSYISTYNR